MIKQPDLLNRPRPLADRRVYYGQDRLQHVDVWLPRTAAQSSGGHPVVVMVHGGCWQTDVARATIMNYIADDLRRRNIAVWNIEYRGVDRNGGGYPGTFHDVARAADLLRTHGSAMGIDVARRVAFGHSAGGHLAFWLAARPKIDRASVLYHPRLLTFEAAISVGGLPDLEAARTPPDNTCGTAAVDALIGAGLRDEEHLFFDTSPAAMMPFGGRQILINTADDHIAPPAIAKAYAARASRSGQGVHRVTVPAEGHVELIAPRTAAWMAGRRAIFDALAIEGSEQ